MLLPRHTLPYNYRMCGTNIPVDITFVALGNSVVIESYDSKNDRAKQQFQSDVLDVFGKRLKLEKYLFNQLNKQK